MLPCMAVCVVIFLLVNVFPKFAELFGDKPDELPGPTQASSSTLSDILRRPRRLAVPGVSIVGLVRH